MPSNMRQLANDMSDEDLDQALKMWSFIRSTAPTGSEHQVYAQEWVRLCLHQITRRQYRAGARSGSGS